MSISAQLLTGKPKCTEKGSLLAVSTCTVLLFDEPKRIRESHGTEYLYSKGRGVCLYTPRAVAGWWFDIEGLICT